MHRYESLNAREGTTPKRPGVWPGTDAEFNDFKNKELEVWRKARAAGVEYKPTRWPFRLVKESGTPGTSAEHFRIVEDTKKPYIFDGGMLSNPAVSQDEVGRPVVVFDVKNEFQNVFGKWTSANQYLPMAIILNGEYRTAPTIRDRLERNVQISLGRANRTEAKKEAEALTTVLQTGSLKIQPELEARNVMGPSLAGASRDRGILAIIVAFALVLVFMVIYYRSSGMIANVALLLNLVMLVGFIGVLPSGAHAARHRGHRAHGRYGGGCQHPDQRTHP